ncbi:FolB domain-containing protein [Niveispirillum sp. SYP-B3756]|uniref:dihydroneopterin aldolase n=1 Tax=Niveispirillum sp. SYP-B3756 TaxID=2662178 RepID=UPI001291BEF8|nr:dihydroneopterin aldolase [Niveispirillum sp. SYP-B3756]MQP63932.1 FolB domain-containing protein [Niveispirillum sp. SYP-B3756]
MPPMMTQPSPLGLENNTPPAPRPRGSARVVDLVIDALIGIYDHELTRPQRLRINLDLTSLPDSLPLDPAQIATQVTEHIQSRHTNLLESLAERLATLLLTDQRVASVMVRLEKPDAFQECEAVGVEIVRLK